MGECLVGINAGLKVATPADSKLTSLDICLAKLKPTSGRARANHAGQ